MFFSKWLRNRLTNPRTKCPASRRQPMRFRPGLEILEDRAVPAVLNVTTQLDVVDPNDGLLSLREAVLQANATNGADTVVVPAGTYLLNGGGELVVTDHLTISGAGAGATVIDGGGAHGVFQIMDAADRVSISGVTIQGGWSVVGGAIACGNSTLTIDHSTICGNWAYTGYGGGIWMALGALTITDSTISSNSASYAGGGIYCNGTTVSIDRSAVIGNSATSFAAGGGMYTAGPATVTVKDSTFSGNFAYDGGGIYDFGATLSVDHSTLACNSAVYGGGILAFGCTLTLAQSTITGNKAESDGGGIWAMATMNLDHSTISGNSAVRGGGIWAMATMDIDHSTISDNTAAQGGGLYAQSSTVEIDQSVLNDPAGGGIFNAGSTIHLKKTVVDGVFYDSQDYF